MGGGRGKQHKKKPHNGGLEQKNEGKKKRKREKNEGKKKRKREKQRALIAEELVKQFAGVERLTLPLFDLHVHSTCSDGLLSPELVIARAFRNGVRVLALTDHDTMAGVPAAVQAACQHGIRVIPGVEISAKNVTRSHASSESTVDESVHILAYYGCCGPSNCAQLEDCLAQVRQGRYRRAAEMVDKLCLLHKPITLEHVLRVAGNGVAPARPHIARALVEAGHVATVGEAFSKYLYNNGPAYGTGAELPAEEVVCLIRQTGGISVLAHPWALKDPVPLIERLKSAGLHAMEVYRSDGKSSGIVTVFGPLAEVCKLVKLGGSDYHGTGTPQETDIGGVALPPLALHEFLKLAEPVWISAVENILQDFAKCTSRRTEKTSVNGVAEPHKGDISVNNLKLLGETQIDQASLTLSPWLSEEERNQVIPMASSLGLLHTVVNVEGRLALRVSR